MVGIGPLFTGGVLLVAVLAGIYQTVLKPLVDVLGIFRDIQPLNNRNCKGIPELEGCEKAVLDEETGLLYAACSKFAHRMHWFPNLQHLNASGRALDDFVAIYDPNTSKVTRLQVAEYTPNRGLSLHGIDIVRSLANPSELFIYLVNHRPPLKGTAEKVGADSAIEIFKIVDGTSIMKHIVTVEDPVILTPNDISGSADGKFFWFTNDHGSKTDFTRKLETFFNYPSTSVGYCHVEQGCKIAAGSLSSANGIVKSKTNDTIYVADTGKGLVRVFEKQTDNTLIVGDVITIGMMVDNLSIDSNGALWVAAFPKALKFVERATTMATSTPSAAFRVTLNTGKDAYFGEKYKVDRIFEDDGSIVQSSTSVVYDPRRGLLFVTGALSPHLAVCKI